MGHTRIRRVLVGVVAVLASSVIAVTALAQTSSLGVVQTSNGSLYLVQGNNAWLLVPNQISDSDFAALNLSGEIDGTIPSQFLTAAPTSTPVPSSPPTPAGPTLTTGQIPFGQTWQGQNVTLTAKGPVYGNDGDCCHVYPGVDFSAENDTGTVLNFTVDSPNIILSIKGKDYPSRSPLNVNNWADTKRIDFTVVFSIVYDSFQQYERDTSVPSYTVTIRGFSSNISRAQWINVLSH